MTEQTQSVETEHPYLPVWRAVAAEFDGLVPLVVDPGICRVQRPGAVYRIEGFPFVLVRPAPLSALELHRKIGSMFGWDVPSSYADTSEIWFCEPGD